MEMGKEIRRLREDRGITQEALAEALNMTAQSVSKWERGTSMPDVQMLPQIAPWLRNSRWNALKTGSTVRGY